MLRTFFPQSVKTHWTFAATPLALTPFCPQPRHMYVYIYIYIYIYTHVYYIHMYVCTYTCIHVYIHMHECMYVCRYTCIYVCTHIMSVSAIPRRPRSPPDPGSPPNGAPLPGGPGQSNNSIHYINSIHVYMYINSIISGARRCIKLYIINIIHVLMLLHLQSGPPGHSYQLKVIKYTIPPYIE